MALKIIDYNSPEYKDMLALRMEILRKPLGLSITKEDLEKEKDDIFIGAFEEEKILACCVLTKMDTGECKLRQMAVHPSMQQNGLGASLLYFAENVARDSGCSTMTMHARKTATGFYEKQGYSVYGNEFEEVTIPHVAMKKLLF
jgi:N-acetylglutamate synthase-like GNAT family acetyltransferase